MKLERKVDFDKIITHGNRKLKGKFGPNGYFTNIQQDGSSNTIAGDKLIAPGSHGQFEIAYGSNSEVAVHFDFEILAESNFYNIPLKWYLNGNEYASLTDVFAAVNGYAPLTDFAAGVSATQSLIISWAWDYEVDDAGDLFDTELGEFDSDVEYVVSFKITATQVEPA